MIKVKFTLASLLFLGFLSMTLMTSCGAKKEEATETTDSTEKAAEHPAEGGEHPKDTTSKDTPA
ncbi:MAG: hypothetical protein O2829_07895 [Bacteroidetes bacterium]|nr:hypothetical protein [Bacteroidota bacterium]